MSQKWQNGILFYEYPSTSPKLRWGRGFGSQPGRRGSSPAAWQSGGETSWPGGEGQGSGAASPPDKFASAQRHTQNSQQGPTCEHTKTAICWTPKSLKISRCKTITIFDAYFCINQDLRVIIVTSPLFWFCPWAAVWSTGWAIAVPAACDTCSTNRPMSERRWGHQVSPKERE